TQRVGVIGSFVARNDVLPALLAQVCAGAGDTAWITRVFASHRQVGREAELVSAGFEQDDPGIGRQAAPSPSRSTALPPPGARGSGGGSSGGVLSAGIESTSALGYALGLDAFMRGHS